MFVISLRNYINVSGGTRQLYTMSNSIQAGDIGLQYKVLVHITGPKHTLDPRSATVALHLLQLTVGAKNDVRACHVGILAIEQVRNFF